MTQSSDLVVAPAANKVPVLVPVWDQMAALQMILREGRYSCGRAQECDLTFDLPGIAENHCDLWLTNGSLHVEETGGRVWINDVPVFGRQRVLTGDHLAVGPATLRVELRAGNAAYADAAQDRRLSASPADETTLTAIQESLAQQFRRLESRLLSVEPKVREAARESDVRRQNPAVLRAAETGSSSAADSGPSGLPPAGWEEVAIDVRQVADSLRSSEGLNTLLDERERRLTDWEQRLESRGESLDQRASELLRQQEAWRTELEATSRRLAETDQKERQQSELGADLDARRRRLSAAVSKLRKQQKALREERAEYDRRAETLRAKQAEWIRVADTERAELTSREARLDAQKQQLAEELEALRAAQAELREAEKKSEADARSLADQIAELGRQKEKFRAQLDQHSAETEAAAVRLSQREEALHLQETEHRRRQSELENSEKALASLEEQISARQQELDERAAELERRDASLAQQAEQLQERDAALSAQAAELEAQAAEAARQLSASEAALAAAQAAEQKAQSLAALPPSDTRAADSEGREAALAAREAALNDDLRGIEELEATVRAEKQDLERRIADFEARVQQAETSEHLLEEYEEKLSRQETALEQLREELRDRDERLSELSKREQEFAELDASRSALADREASLAAWDHELRDRHAELSERLIVLKDAVRKSLIAQQDTDTQPDGTDSRPSADQQAPAEDLTHALNDALAQCEHLRGERESLGEALNELKTAFVSARDELSARVTEVSKQADEIETLRSRLRENDEAVEREQSRAEELDRELAALRAEHEELTGRLDRLTSVASDSADAAEGDDRELALLEEINSLRAELSGVHSGRDEKAGELEQSLQDREREITELRQKISELEAEREAAASDPNAGTVAAEGDSEAAGETESEQTAALQSALRDLRDQLLERESVVRELQQKLEAFRQSGPDGAPVDEASLLSLQRELDMRAELLDRREESLTERTRQLDDSVGKIEEQRRDLREQRQQLELTRADLQVSTAASVEPSDDITKTVAIPPAGATQPVDAEEAARAAAAAIEAEGDEESTEKEERKTTPVIGPDGEEEKSEGSESLRSELADLFGISRPGELSAVESEADDDTGSKKGPQAVETYSQETHSTVGLKFDDAAAVLLEPDPVSEETSAEEDDTDVVAAYMEQLLARSRTSTGASGEKEDVSKSGSFMSGSVPVSKSVPAARSEPVSRSTSTSTSRSASIRPGEKAEPAAEEKPKATSFLDAWMNGSLKLSDGEEDSGAAAGSDLGALRPAEPMTEFDTEGAGEPADRPPSVPREKVDRDALRSSLNSFRELSTQSVENALASHAMKQQHRSIMFRVTLIVAFTVVAIFAVAAALFGIVPWSWLTWVILAAPIFAGAELALKMQRLKAELRHSIQKELEGRAAAAPVPGGSAPAEIAAAAFAGDGGESQGAESAPEPEPATEAIAEGSGPDEEEPASETAADIESEILSTGREELAGRPTDEDLSLPRELNDESEEYYEV